MLKFVAMRPRPARNGAVWLRRTGASACLHVPPRAAAEIEESAIRAAKAVLYSNSKVPTPTVGELGFIKNARISSPPRVSPSSAGAAELVLDVAAPFPASQQAGAVSVAAADAASVAISAVASRLGLQAPISVRSNLVPSRHSNAGIAKAGPGLAGVGSVVAVSSCKGGVGKSTVAVNLAFALKALNDAKSRVGLLDTDIYGPSLPTMVTPSSVNVVQNGNKEGSGTINPLTYEGVQCMSYGWVSRRNPTTGERGGAVMRGPMVSQVVSQLLRLTNWGELDHLLLDMPPGTGDIQITLGQTVPITGAVIVTTPQKLAVVDVTKGLDMFAALKVPTLAVVLNMAHFDAPDTGKRYYPFGEGGLDRVRAVMERYGVPSDRLFTLPIDPALSTAGDAGVPEVVAHPSSPSSLIYKQLASAVATDVETRIMAARIAALQSSTSTAAGSAPSGAVTVRFDPSRGLVIRSISDTGASEAALNPATVRRACRCAACVDEFSGEQRLKPESVPDTVIPRDISEMGNYGTAITWSDGHTSSIYTHDQLLQLANAS